jgi:uncharacterized RDD family membrane protein YckC
MRLVAALIDGAITVVLIVAASIVIGLIVGPTVGRIVSTLLVLGYFSMEIFKAQSVGKMVFKFNITKQDGAPAPQDLLIKRYLVKMAPVLIGLLAVIPFVGLIFSLLSGLAWVALIVSTILVVQPGTLAFHDRLLGTAVYGPVKPTLSIPQVGPANAAAPAPSQSPPPPAV